jgi:hypothetical protein
MNTSGCKDGRYVEPTGTGNLSGQPLYQALNGPYNAQSNIQFYVDVGRGFGR